MDSRFDKTEAICRAVALTECKLDNTGSNPRKGTLPFLLHYVHTGICFSAESNYMYFMACGK